MADLAPGEVRLRMHGPDLSAATVREAAGHSQGLLRELTRAQCGNPDAIGWEVGEIRIVCDGCDRDRPEIHDAWVYSGGGDLCPACQAKEIARG